VDPSAEMTDPMKQFDWSYLCTRYSIYTRSAAIGREQVGCRPRIVPIYSYIIIITIIIILHQSLSSSSE